MEVHELLNIFGRIISILPLLLGVTLFMGRRVVGEMPIFDFLVIITLASVTGADIADPSVNHVYTAFAIVFIGLFQKLIGLLIIKKRIFGKLVTFKPIEVIKNGEIIVDNLNSVQYSIDNVLQLLRQKNIFNIADVELAIIEASGKISAQKKPEKTPPTIEDLGLKKLNTGLAYPLIIEGKIDNTVLSHLNLSEETLRKKLLDKGIIRIEEIFLCTINDQNDLHLAYTNQLSKLEEIEH